MGRPLQHTMLEWTPMFQFAAFVKHVPGTIKINVMERFDPVHRYKVSPCEWPWPRWHLSV